MSRHIRASALALTVATSLSGCDGIFGPDGGLEYVVERLEVVQEEVDWAPDPVAFLEAEIGIVNTGDDTASTDTWPCPAYLEAFPTDDAERLVWRSQAHTSWPLSTPLVCVGMGVAYRVEPGETVSVPLPKQSLASILADSLPAGSYDFRATLSFEAGPVRVDLGTVNLPTSRYPLPDRVSYRDGFRYEAEIDDAGAETVVRLHIGYSATRAGPLERDLLSACPVRLLAFQEADDVTTIPVPDPVWSWPETCPTGAESVTLAPDESRTFERPLDLEDVAGIAGPGPYHLMGLVEVDGRVIRLAVGEIHLLP